MHSKVLLLVDDNRYWLNTLTRFFSSYKYKIYTAETCAEAVKQAGIHQPDCMLLDFHLPDGKGDKVCRAIREDQRLKSLPIIMLSIDAGRELDSYMEYKTDGFILKGASLMKIKAVVESVLRRVRWDSGVIERGDIRLEARDFGVYRDARLVSELSADQFHLFCLLLEKKQEFVSDEIVSSYVFKEDPESDKSDAVRSLVCRLRKKLGPQLARRIKSSRDKGWIYIQPRDRKTWKIG